jgi:hypothetical protein
MLAYVATPDHLVFARLGRSALPTAFGDAVFGILVTESFVDMAFDRGVRSEG